ncbi:MAG: Wzz/FepE/Etk N-terminal domain-containing protein [Gammaproteobacteria bacterium]|nr:Wzz/FepE/Etk N-terminal domain-containing protein [Gammaproteobacteria bacterium]MDH5652105.1 Wzz/FepE/Etk N-terminal domain-containing protein [Gammaproteobacteria bacterium]
MNNSSTIQNTTEVSIYDLLDIIVKRKLVVIGVFVLAVCLAGAYLLLKKPSYLITAELEVGQLGRLEGAVEEYNEIVGQLNKLKGLSVKSVRSQYKNHVAVMFSMRSSQEDLQSSVDRMNQLLNEIVDRQNKKFDEFTRLNTNYVQSLKDQRNRLLSARGELQKTYKSARIDEFNYQQAKTRLEMDLLDVTGNLLNYRTKQMKSVSFPSYIREPVTVQSYGIKPNKAVTIFGGACLGLFLGLIMAFIVEFMANYLAYRKQCTS